MIYTAIVLAGGKSSRMGFDKQQIKIGNITMTEYILESLKPLFKDIIVVTNSPELYENKNITIIEDIYKGIGPIAGIHAGLTKSQSDYNYIIACDMPFINIEYIKYLMERAKDGGFRHDAIVTKDENDRIETLNGFYSKRILTVIDSLINSGKKSILDLLAAINAEYIEYDIVRKFSPDWLMFTNLNTEKDLEKLKLLYSREKGL